MNCSYVLKPSLPGILLEERPRLPAEFLAPFLVESGAMQALPKALNICLLEYEAF